MSISNSQPEERLDSFDDTRKALGFKSRTSVYEAIKTDAGFPRPVYRGRNVYFFHSEILAYLEKLRIKRDTQVQVAQAAAAKDAAQRMVTGRLAKRAKAAQRRAAGGA